MTYPKHLFRHPGPYGSGATSYEVAGADDEEGEALLASLGWSPTKPGAEPVKPAPKPYPLDHDGDGKKGGSLPAPNGIKGLRAEYKELAGSQAFMGWDEATLREKIAALKDAKA